MVLVSQVRAFVGQETGRKLNMKYMYYTDNRTMLCKIHTNSISNRNYFCKSTTNTKYLVHKVFQTQNTQLYFVFLI